jgi:hypothetical protein
MVRWKIYVGSKQRGQDYDNENKAIANGAVIARSNKQVYVYKVVNGDGPKQIAKWVDGDRIG